MQHQNNQIMYRLVLHRVCILFCYDGYVHMSVVIFEREEKKEKTKEEQIISRVSRHDDTV